MADQSWWDMLFSANFFEALIYATLMLVSWLAMALQFYISLFQRVLLMLCWVLSAPLLACYSIPFVSGLALRHCLRILGILTWPLGLALASCVTDGLIDMQTDQNFFFGGDANVAVGAGSYVLVNLLSIAAVGLWILFSSVLAPVMMQRLISGGSGSAAMIPRAAQLLVQDGPPALKRSISFLSRSRQSRRDTSDHESPPSLIKVEPTPSSPIEAPSLRPPNADDPTAENAVRQAMDESDKDKLL